MFTKILFYIRRRYIYLTNRDICSGLYLIKCVLISTSVMKCILSLLTDFTITSGDKYEQQRFSTFLPRSSPQRSKKQLSNHCQIIIIVILSFHLLESQVLISKIWHTVYLHLNLIGKYIYIWITAVDGGWSAWSSTACSVTCGQGTQKRTRECNDPKPQYGGEPCFGNETVQDVDCNNGPCPSKTPCLTVIKCLKVHLHFNMQNCGVLKYLKLACVKNLTTNP